MSKSGISSFKAILPFLGVVFFCTVAVAQLLLGAGDGRKPAGGGGGGVIAFDASSFNSCSGTSFSHTITGSSPFLIVFTFGNNAGAETVTGLTYNSVALTQIQSLQDAGVGTGLFQDAEVWYLKAPATGANTLAATVSGGAFCILAGSYTGVNQTSPIDSFSGAMTPPTGNSDPANNAASWSQATTVVAANSWLVGRPWSLSGGEVASTGTTERTGGHVFDSNGTVGTGSQSLNWTTSGSTMWFGVQTVSIKP